MLPNAIFIIFSAERYNWYNFLHLSAAGRKKTAPHRCGAVMWRRRDHYTNYEVMKSWIAASTL